MDTLTHALSGALLARATAPRHWQPGTLPLGRRMTVGFLAAAFPDIDFVSGYISSLAYLYHHRGVTHSILLLPLWAFMLATLFAVMWRMKPGWRAYIGVCALALGAHIAGDVITGFGTIVFAPLSDLRVALSTTFIIDLYFTGIIVAGLLGSWLLRSSTLPSQLALTVLCVYVGGQYLLQQQAIDFGSRYAASNGWRNVKVSAIPRPVSPLNWTVVVEEGGGRYRYAHINLLRREVKPAPGASTGFVARLDAAYRPLDQALWQQSGRFGTPRDDMAFAREAFQHPDFAFFRWFAAYPILSRIDTNERERCAWFQDLRFATPGRDGMPFQYGMCRRGARWQPFQLIGGSVKAEVD